RLGKRPGSFRKRVYVFLSHRIPLPRFPANREIREFASAGVYLVHAAIGAYVVIKPGDVMVATEERFEKTMLRKIHLRKIFETGRNGNARGIFPEPRRQHASPHCA